MAEQELKFKDNLNDIQDQWLFAGVFIAGVLPMVILRAFTPAPSWAVTLWLVFCMSAYAGLIWKTKRYRLREDRSADNLYFLGFLFTVTALLISLVKFAQDTDGDALANNPLVVVGDLGIGLTTTLLGLFLRVFFTQLRKDPEEIEETVRLSLTDAADKVAKDIIETATIVEESSTLTKQILEESRNLLAEQKELCKEIFEQTRSDIKDASGKLVASVSRLEARVSAIEVREDIISAKLDPPLNSASNSLLTFSSKAAEVDIPKDMLVSRMQVAVNSFGEALVEAVATNAKDISESATGDIKKEIERVGKEIAILIGNMEVPPNLIQEQLQPAIDAFTAQFERLNTEVDPKLRGFSSSITKTLENMKTAESQGMEQIEEINKAIEKIKMDFDNHFEGLGEKLSQGIEKATTTVNGASDIYQENAVNAFNGFDRRLQSPVETLNTSVGELTGSFNSLKSQIEEASKSLESLKTLIPGEGQTATPTGQQNQRSGDV